VNANIALARVSSRAKRRHNPTKLLPEGTLVQVSRELVRQSILVDDRSPRYVLTHQVLRRYSLLAKSPPCDERDDGDACRDDYRYAHALHQHREVRLTSGISREGSRSHLAPSAACHVRRRAQYLGQMSPTSEPGFVLRPALHQPPPESWRRSLMHCPNTSGRNLPHGVSDAETGQPLAKRPDPRSATIRAFIRAGRDAAAHRTDKGHAKQLCTVRAFVVFACPLIPLGSRIRILGGA